MMTAHELRHWLTAAGIALVIAVIVAVIVRAVGEHNNVWHQQQAVDINYLRGQIDMLTKRVEDLENSRTAATAKRYTSDDAARDRAAIYACIKQRAACPD